MQPARVPGKFRGSHQTPVSLHAHPCAKRDVTSSSFVQESGRGAAGRWSAAGAHAAKARRESFNGITTQRRKEARKFQTYREIPVPGKAFPAFCVDVAEDNKKSTREQCFAGEQARFRPAQSTINQFLC